MPECDTSNLNINISHSISEIYSFGKPRLKPAILLFQNNEISLNDLTNVYRDWVSYDEYVLISISYENITLWKFIKCSKRGNDVYYHRLKQRLGWIDELPEKLLNTTFFTDDDILDGDAYTQMLFITLTYDTKRCSLQEAWKNIGKEFNAFLSNLRKRFGKISVFRVFRAFRNGYPHVHCIIYFHNFKFRVSYYDEKWNNGKCHKIYRIDGHTEFKKYWHSFVDVCAIHNVRGALKYVAGYILGNVISSYDDEPYPSTYNDELNFYYYNQELALLWVNRKRNFSVSGDFRKTLYDLIRRGVCISKTNNYPLALLKFLYFKVHIEWWGVYTPADLGIDGKRWVYVSENMPKVVADSLSKLIKNYEDSKHVFYL